MKPNGICIIHSFETRNMKKYALCHVYQKLRNTYIGGIKDVSPFKKLVSNANLDQEEYVKYKEIKAIRLRRFKEKVDDFVPPSETMQYELISSKSVPFITNKHGIGHGFVVAYNRIPDGIAGERMEDSESNDCGKFIDDYDWDEWESKHPDKFTNPKRKSDIDPVFENSTLHLRQVIKQLQNQNGSAPSQEAELALNEVQKAHEHDLEDKNKALIKETEEKLKGQDQLKKEIDTTSSDTIKVIDFFSGIGGMSIGFPEAGLETLWGVEDCSIAIGTFKLNHDKKVYVFDECIKIWFDKMRETLEHMKQQTTENNEHNPYAQVLEKASHAHFSPPCQAVSIANSTGGTNDVGNAGLTLLSAMIAVFLYQHGNVKSISFENVTGLLNQKNNDNNSLPSANEDYLKTFISALLGVGMNVRLFVLDSERYGDPQGRARVFVMAVKPDLILNQFPIPTHGDGYTDRDAKGNLLPKFRCPPDVLRDLEAVKPVKGNGFVEYETKDGLTKSVFHHCIEGTSLKAEMQRLKPNEPAGTIIGKFNVLHYDEMLNRCITLREQARLQSFPDDFQFLGNQTQIVKGIGNAVPVRTAVAVAKYIKSSYSATGC